MRSTPRTRRAAVLVATGTAAAARVAGCGSSGGRSGAPGTSGGTGAPAGVTLRTAHGPGLGTIVTDSAGFTLYRFDQDGTSPPESYCNGNCAALRPPEQAHGNVAGTDSKPLGTVTRSDGVERVTLNGSPRPADPTPTSRAPGYRPAGWPMAADRPRARPPPPTTDGR
ncbi:hypothetical protein ACIGXI_30490 [Kitasatospora aureofaciens]|uniref:hypothetical protein n=1 Tax=Kitasatospora aureofaciens TaxID=1894 RepID=UPI0037C84287